MINPPQNYALKSIKQNYDNVNLCNIFKQKMIQIYKLAPYVFIESIKTLDYAISHVADFGIV